MSRKREGRITPENITELKKGEVFVFGSNEGGIHSAGAAKIAKEKFGAEMGKGWGPTGQCFALPTKNWNVSGTLPMVAIECYIGRFVEYILLNPDKKFLITKIGCGLAGLKPEDIAPLFSGLDELPNVSLPVEFWDILDKTYREDTVKELIFENDGAKNELSNL